MAASGFIYSLQMHYPVLVYINETELYNFQHTTKYVVMSYVVRVILQIWAAHTERI
jgi:hypothetical protein